MNSAPKFLIPFVKVLGDIDMKYYVNVNGFGTFWYKDSAMKVLHREGGPAVEYADGSNEWYINGKRHREDGPAVEDINGFKEWYINGNRHREGGPAAEDSAGYKAWYKDGKPHREDGPAVEWATGAREWWIDGKNYSEAEFSEKVNPTVEMTVADIEKLLGKKVKIVK
jgi:hypothetical protein